ncbi:MAG: hypothetical protein IJW24_00455 [Clostridia bacterium]|nr:hypothetical protein [Clostridia bacterium]
MKKGLLTTVIVGLVLAVSLSIYTIVACCLPSNPVYVPAHYNSNLAFRTGETISEFEGYSVEAGNLVMTFENESEDDSDAQPEGSEPEVVSDTTAEENVIIYDAETGVYTAAKAGKATVVLSEENGDTKTFVVTVYDHDALGTVDGVPYVICNAAHLAEYADLANNGSDDVTIDAALAMDIAVVADIDLSEIDWMPIGTCATPFSGTIEGNGHTISNMTIRVTTENYTDFISRAKRPNNDINLGFFGKTVNAEILNLNFNSSYIYIDNNILSLVASRDFKTLPGLENAVVGSISAGTVAGYMTRTTYTSTVAETNVEISDTVISGFSYNGDPSAIIPNGLGTVAGVMSESQISNVEINSEIYANSLIVEGSRVGGVVAYVQAFDPNAGNTETDIDHKSEIDNVIVTSTVYTRYYLGAAAEEASNYYMDKFNTVGLIAANANNIDVSNVTVKNSRILDYNGTIQNIEGNVLPNEDYLALLSGGVAVANSVTNDKYAGNDVAFRLSMTNVSVENVFSNPAGQFGGIVGIAGANTTFTDCSVSNLEAHGYAVGGFAYEIKENAVVKYTESFNDELAVDANVGGIKTAGFAVIMSGKLEGVEVAATADTPARKTTFKSNITGYGSYIDDIADANGVVAAGFACYMYGTIADYEVSATNFDVITNINKSVNIVGLVGLMGETYNENVAVVLSSTNLDNINVEMTAKSYFNRKLGLSTTKIVAGAVGQIFDGATINGVNVEIVLNDGVTTENYGAAIFGGLVAHVLAESAVITNNSVNGDVTIVEHNFSLLARKLVEADATYYIQIAGGLVGLIASFDYSDVTVSGLEIANNSVSGFSMNIVGDHAYPGTDENTGAIFFRVRGVGSLVGNVNHTSDTENNLDLSSNTLSNVNVAANKAAFTYKVSDGDQVVKEFVLLGTNLSSAVGTTLEYIAQDGLVNITLPSESGSYTDNSEVA